jgi:hypothetical protein
MERRGKNVRLAPTGSTVDVSIGIDIERGDAALVMGHSRSHARQAHRKRDHRALANKLVRKLLFIRFYGWRIRIESALCLHGRVLF